MQCILMLYLDVYALLQTRQTYLHENSDRRIVMNFSFLSSSDVFLGLFAADPDPDSATPLGSGAFTTGAMMAITAAGTGVDSAFGRATHVGGAGTIIALTIGGGAGSGGSSGGGGFAEATMFGASVVVSVGLAFLLRFAFFAVAVPPPFESSAPQWAANM